jgi:hypothetical protein
LSELHSFARIAGDPTFRAWLEKERDAAIKYLTSAVDPVQIHRAQGRVLLVEELLSNLEKAKGLR